MSDEHKAALARGREESRLVKAYLELLESTTPKRRGRKRSPESISKRLAAIEQSLVDASALDRLHLLQEKADLEAELASLTASGSQNIEEARAGFIKVAKSYSERKGISYSTWRAAGVDAATLKEAGITRAM